jgi:hypothetical protein
LGNGCINCLRETNLNYLFWTLFSKKTLFRKKHFLEKNTF